MIRARRWIPLAMLLANAPALAQGGLGDEADRLAKRALTAIDGVFGERPPEPRMRGVYLLGEAATPADAPAWNALGKETPERVVLLVHGLDEPGSIWDDLAPALRGAGFAVARFEFPNDQGIGASARELGAALRTLRAAGTRRVDLVCHSMGGLVAWDSLTSPGDYAGKAQGSEELPAVDRLFLIGTPFRGSELARARAVTEVREQVLRWWATKSKNVHELARAREDGLGEAGDDLRPGSAYLSELMARPRPQGGRTTVIVGRVTAAAAEGITEFLKDPVFGEILTPEEVARLSERVRGAAAKIESEVGDGVVPMSSARLENVEDTVVLEGSHRGMLERTTVDRALTGADQPPAIAIILERLGRP